MQVKQARALGTLIAFTVVAAAAVAGCRGPALSPAAPDTAESGRLLIFSKAFAGVQPGETRVVDFSVPRAGTIQVSVGWTDMDNSVITALTGLGCIDLRRAGDGCQLRESVERPSGREGRERVFNFRERAGAYRLWVENLGPGAETIDVRAELTFATDAPPTTPSPAPERRGRESRERHPQTP